jgi:hypothetical protein
MYTYCPGCQRKCLGFVTLCLDCEFAVDEMGQTGYRDGFHGALEWGIAHPFDLQRVKQNAPPPTSHVIAIPAAALSSPSFAQAYQRGYRNGYQRGIRCAKTRLSLYRAVLGEFLIDLGRRRALLYCVGVLRRLSPAALEWFDPNLLRLIGQYF